MKSNVLNIKSIAFLLIGACHGFLFDGLTYLPNYDIEQGSTMLPQYQTYGKSLVLVGGNLAEDNAEIYNTIVEMAVFILCNVYTNTDINFHPLTEFIQYLTNVTFNC